MGTTYDADAIPLNKRLVVVVLALTVLAPMPAMTRGGHGGGGGYHGGWGGHYGGWGSSAQSSDTATGLLHHRVLLPPGRWLLGSIPVDLGRHPGFTSTGGDAVRASGALTAW